MTHDEADDKLAALLARLDDPTKLDRIDKVYSLVFRKIPGHAGFDWRVATPYFLTQEEGREIVLTLRDTFRERGYDVEVIQQATVTDVIA